MQPTLTIGNAQVYLGNNLDVLPTLPDNSVDSIVCDPPYELGFMGKSWDNSGIAYSVELWQQCLRVLKPGGHLLAFGGTRTWHRLAVAIEDAGFEIRDNIAWLYGSGFPKSHDISKAIDKLHGAERQVVGQKADYLSKRGAEIKREAEGGLSNLTQSNMERGGDFYATPAAAGYNNTLAGSYITAPATDEAKKWDGWGTALKPAHEPIVVARKPLIGTVAENVLTYGTGAINIDATRIGTEETWQPLKPKANESFGTFKTKDRIIEQHPTGRWPANIILDEHTAEVLDEQSGNVKGKVGVKHLSQFTFTAGGESKNNKFASQKGLGDSGGASRFFYVAKANKRDRNEGLNELPEVAVKFGNQKETIEGSVNDKFRAEPKQNFHPTVKPTALMQYLIRLVTPNNGVVLDPFAGSGSTGKAAILEDKKFIGIELTSEYLPIIEGRLKHAHETMQQQEEDLFE